MNTSSHGWLRVNKADPCPICGHPDWCSVSADGAVAICMREPAGSVKPTRNGGYLHRLGEARPVAIRTRRFVLPTRAIGRQDLEILAANYQTAVPPRKLQRLAASLGLSVWSLERLGVGWAFDMGAWSFPMTDVEGHVLGIRLRSPEGRKFSVVGGHEGLFIPTDLPPFSRRLCISEGPTDCAALLDLGLVAVGRPSCTGGERLLLQLVKKYKPQQVVIVADGDEPGTRGANRLAESLALVCSDVRSINPPAGIKDVRAWKLRGGAAADLLAEVEAASRFAIGIRLERRAGKVA